MIDLPDEIRGLFVDDARRHLREATALIPEWGVGAPVATELRRHAHSLKGLVAAVGLAELRELARALEALVVATAGRGAAPAGRLDLFVEALAALGQAVDAVERGVEPSTAGAGELARRLDTARLA